jgi:phosphate transport system substrate-binding protein
MNLVDTNYTIDEIKTLLTVDGNNSGSQKIKVVFDNNNSSTLNFLTEKTGIKEISKNCYALNSNQAVVDYISKEKNSIGVIGVNWISDNDDTTHLSFLKSAKVWEISSGEKLESFKPYQAYIAQKIYPLWREVYMLSREAYTGLGTGFTSFVASERGQRIVLKSGLVPATMPVRFVELINEEITN